MTPNKRIINLAEFEAKNSNHRFRVGAVIFRGSVIIGRGFNNADKTHPKSPHPYKSIHAEFSAFLHAFRLRNDLTDCSIYVHRILRDGSPGLAKPCQWCTELLAKIGVKDVHWSV